MDTVKLSNGAEMPIPGYGVFQVSPEECERCASDAISVGYRLIDTVQAYGNEESTGNAVRTFDSTLSDEDMEAILILNEAKTLFFSHTDPTMVKWLVNYGK